MRRFVNWLLEVAGLQTARGRLAFFGLASIGIFIVPYDWLAGLSIWQRLGIPSPSIGLTRAYWHVLHFDFAAAWARNPLIYAVLAVGVPLLVVDGIRTVRWVRRG